MATPDSHHISGSGPTELPEPRPGRSEEQRRVELSPRSCSAETIDCGIHATRR
jgi:hypothetical protein